MQRKYTICHCTEAWENKISYGKQYGSITYTFSKQGNKYIATLKLVNGSNVDIYKTAYKIDGNKIIYTFDNGNEMTEEYSLSGNTLIIDGRKFTKK